MFLFDGTISGGTLALLLICLFIALAFEFVNGFHDTANAVATVIYTKSLPPWAAVVWSGMLNFLGVLLGGVAVAFSIVHLLPVDLLINIGASAGIWMVLSLLVTAILWNLGTWYFGLPASSSHTLIGSILGVGLASSIFSGAGFGSGVNWTKAQQIGLSLLVSPLIGFTLAGGLLLLSKALVKNPALYREPDGENPPPLWIRAILVITCSGVSFAHGSNDGQKGVGLIMLILIGILPAQYALNTNLDAAKVQQTVVAVESMERMLVRTAPDLETPTNGTSVPMTQALQDIQKQLSATPNLPDLSPEARSALRQKVLEVDETLNQFEKQQSKSLSVENKETLKKGRAALRGLVDFVVAWVVVAVALALGIGTTVGWKRIVITVGEKIGKSHLTYAQGAAAEVVAMLTIFAADKLGLPVSTTHVLSSGIAGTMAANRFGIQRHTVQKIVLAWVLTLPVTMALAGILFAMTAGSQVRAMGDKARVKARQSGILRKVE